jgi:hypothetical protein
MPLCPLALTQTLFVSLPLGRDQRPRWSACLPLLPTGQLINLCPLIMPSGPRFLARLPLLPLTLTLPLTLITSLPLSLPRALQSSTPLALRPSSPLINCSTKYPYPPTVYNNPLNDNSNNACSKMRIKLDGVLFLLHSPSRVRLGRTPETGPLRVLKIHHRKVRKAAASNRPAPIARSVS